MILENEELLIQKAKNNINEFSVLYQHYVSEIYYFLLVRLNNNEELAEDLTSLTFLKALQALPNYVNSNFRAWLYRIANNVLIDHFRKNKKYTSAELQILDYLNNKKNNIDDNFVENIDKEILLDIIKVKMKKLKEKDQEILNLKYFTHLSNKEIAEVLDITESNVAVRLHRAIKKLTKLINEN